MRSIAEGEIIVPMTVQVFHGKGATKDGLGLIILWRCIGPCFCLHHPGQVLIHINPVYQGKTLLPRKHQQVIVIGPGFQFRIQGPEAKIRIQVQGFQLESLGMTVIPVRVKHLDSFLFKGKIQNTPFVHSGDFLSVHIQLKNSFGTVHYG